MLQITTSPLPRQTNGNSSHNMQRVEEPIRSIIDAAHDNRPVDEAVRERLSPKADNFFSLNLQFANSIRQPVASSITRKIQKLDADRDRTINQMIRLVRLGLKSSKENIAEAAIELDVITRLYSNIPNRQQDEQTRITDKLIKDLRVHELKHCVKIVPGVESLLEMVEILNDEFAVFFNERMNDREHIITGYTSDIRLQAEKALNEVFFNINAIAAVYDEGYLNDAISTINNILDQARLDLSARRRGHNVRKHKSKRTPPLEHLPGPVEDTPEENEKLSL